MLITLGFSTNILFDIIIYMKKIVLFLICIFCLCGCSSKNPLVSMEIENYGTIKIELYPDYAPNTVANFVNLIESGFYDNNNFHRLMPGFVLQGGDPKGTGSGGPGYKILGEFKNNGYYGNTLKHTRGVISMARTAFDYNSAGSQFFIVLSDDYRGDLDDNYAAFGKVIEGMDIIDKIVELEEVQDASTGKLKNNIIITKTTVETYGKEYKVKKLEE